ncbi:MAG: DegV family protein [Oscillospiraceae bacterium]|nr:DegV family protein [Oscillospiraceae bacterium]
MDEKKFVIVTDTNADFPEEYLKNHGLGRLCLSFSVDGNTFCADQDVIDEHAFYDQMRAGADVKTMQVNPEKARAYFEEYLKNGLEVLYLAFSSGLSGSYNSALIAADELKELYPDLRVVVVDTLCASLGQGLLTHYAVTMKEKGRTMDEIVSWVEENRLHLCHMFTVDDLNHLYRGGRVSKTAAVLGTVLNIKPLLHVDDAGKLVPLGKVRGRKQSLLGLVNMMEERIGSYHNEIFFVSHGDCLEDAKFVASEVQKRFGIQKHLIHFIGPTIGAHSGPGTVALFFLGERR